MRHAHLAMACTLALLSQSAMGQEADTPDADSSQALRASLVVSAPSEALFSVFGHLTFRMESPIHGLDYVYTYESDSDVGNFMTFIAGKATAKYVAVPTSTYVADGREIGREIRQYRLNLTQDECRELWRLLDDDMMAGGYRHFNLHTSNCVSTAIEKIQACLVDDSLEWGVGGVRLHLMSLSNGEWLRETLHRSPWAEFIYVTFIGTMYDGATDVEHRPSPELLVPLLREASLTRQHSGERRPAIVGDGVTLVEERQHPTATPLSPIVVFGALLAVTLLVTIMEWRKDLRRWADRYDTLLFGAQALVSLLLIYVTFRSEMFGSHWNWYLLLFNPLPLLLLPVSGKARHAATWWLAYSLMTVLFIAATPFVGVLDLPHQLASASVLTRTASRYRRCKQTRTGTPDKKQQH